MTPDRRRGSRVRLVVLAIASAAVVVGGVGPTASLVGHSGHRTALDMRGQSVALDPGVTPVPAASAQADIGTRLQVPSVELDVPLGALTAVDGQITPPGFTSAYWIRNMGVPVADSSRGTVFVVMHSLRNGGIGPGNYLTDVATQTARVRDGAIVRIAGVTFTVTGSDLISKSTIATDSTVWSATPNRLLLITCLEHPDGSLSTENLVVTAKRSS
ncbi:MAG: hypothetical protein JWP75_1711 [Frondihabitans sp.]|nr:hypothetical protein [Frondihabitans sp.]